MFARGSRLLGPLLFLSCTLSPFPFPFEDLHCLFEAWFSICTVLLILVVWYSLSWLIPRGFGLDFIFFSFVGGLRGAEPSSLLGDILFFVGSLLQRRKVHSDFVGLTSPRGGKRPYFSFLTLRPGLLLCSDLSFFCN